MKHDDDIPFMDSFFAEGPSRMLKDNDNYCLGIVDKGDLVSMLSIDQIPNDRSRTKNALLGS